jgi:hypothetical protein
VNDAHKSRSTCSTPGCLEKIVDKINEIIINRKDPAKLPTDEVIAIVLASRIENPITNHQDPQEQLRIEANRRCRFLLLMQGCMHSFGLTIGGISRTSGAPRELLVTTIGTNLENSGFAFPKAHSPREETFVGFPSCKGCIDPRCKALWPIADEKANDIKSQLGYLTKSDLIDFEIPTGLRIEQAVSSAVTSQALSPPTR